MEIVLILVLLFVILPAVGGWLLRAWLRRSFNRFNREAGNNEANASGKTANGSRKNRQKVFTQEDGEYVDYEEIKSPNEPPKTPPA